MNLTAHLDIECLMDNYCMRWRGIFKGLSQDGGRADFSKKPSLTLNKDPSNEPNYDLTGQYL